MKKKLLFWFVFLTLEASPFACDIDTLYYFPDTTQFIHIKEKDGEGSNIYTILNSKQNLQIQFYPPTDTAWIVAGCTGPDIIAHNFVSTPFRDSIIIEPGQGSYFFYYDSLGNQISTDNYYFIVQHLTNYYEYEIWFHPKSWLPFNPILIPFDSAFHFYQNQFNIQLVVKLNGTRIDSLSQFFEARWGLSVKADQKVMEGFTLFQNYPNPFNPSTTISWQSPVNSWQTLKVYDVLGNEVSTLVDEYKPVGSYEIEFNSASSIKHLTSGIYYYRLKAGKFIQTKKMIYLK